MSKGLEAIRARRAALVRRAAVERDELATRFERWRTPLTVVDWGLTFFSTLQKSAPLFGLSFGIGAAALAVARPKRIAGWVRSGLAFWGAFRTVADLVQGRRRLGKRPALESE